MTPLCDENGRPLCERMGKVGYRKKSAARKAITLLARRKTLRGNLQPFDCPWCAHWHIGRNKR